MFLPNFVPQFPLYKDKPVNNTDHNGILTFISRQETMQK